MTELKIICQNCGAELKYLLTRDGDTLCKSCNLAISSKKGVLGGKQ